MVGLKLFGRARKQHHHPSTPADRAAEVTTVASTPTSASSWAAESTPSPPTDASPITPSDSFARHRRLDLDLKLPPSPPPQLSSQTLDFGSPDLTLLRTRSHENVVPTAFSSSQVSLGVYGQPAASRSTLAVPEPGETDERARRLKKPSLRDIFGRAFSSKDRASAEALDQGSPMEELAATFASPSTQSEPALLPSPVLHAEPVIPPRTASAVEPAPSTVSSPAAPASAPLAPVPAPKPSSSSFFSKLRRGSAASKGAASDAHSILTRKSSASSSVRPFPVDADVPAVPPIPAQHASTTTSVPKRPGLASLIKGRNGRSGSVSSLLSDFGPSAKQSQAASGEGGSFSVRSCHNVRNGSASSLLLPVTIPAPSSQQPAMVSPTDIIMSYATSDPSSSPKKARSQTAPPTPTTTTIPVPGPGPRMSAAAFRERAAMRSSVTSFASSRSDLGLPLSGAENQDVSPYGSWRGSENASPRTGNRLGLPYLPSSSSPARSEVSLPTQPSDPPPAKNRSRSGGEDKGGSGGGLIGQIPPLEFQGVKGFGRVKAKSEPRGDDEPLVPPRPAFYGQHHRSGSSSNASVSSLKSAGGGSDAGGAASEGWMRGRQASFGSVTAAVRSASPAASVRSLPSAIKGGRLLRQQNSGGGGTPPPMPTPPRPSPSKLLTVPSGATGSESQRSSFEAWQTPAGGSESEEDEGREVSGGSVEELSVDAHLQAPGMGPRQESFQSARSHLSSPLRIDASALPPKRSEADGSSDEDDVPLSQLKTKRSLPGSPVDKVFPSPPASQTTPTKAPSLRSMASAKASLVTADRFFPPPASSSTAAAGKTDASSAGAAKFLHGRSMSTLSSTTRSSSTVTDPSSATEARRPPLPNVASAPSITSLGPSSSTSLLAYGPRGYSPASSSSGSMPLTPKDQSVVGILTANSTPGVASSPAPAKPSKVTFDASVVDRKVAGQRKPLYPTNAGLGTPSSSPSRGPAGSWRSVSDMRSGPTSNDDDDDSVLGFGARGKSAAAAAMTASSLRGRGHAPSPSASFVPVLGSMPPPPGVDPYLFASLPLDQKMQLHQRSQMMMMMAAQAQQAAQIQAMAAMAAATQPFMSGPSVDAWETRSAFGPVVGQPMVGLNAQFPMMPWMGGGGSASAVGVPQLPRSAGSAIGLGRNKDAPVDETGRFRFKTK